MTRPSEANWACVPLIFRDSNLDEANLTAAATVLAHSPPGAAGGTLVWLTACASRAAIEVPAACTAAFAAARFSSVGFITQITAARAAALSGPGNLSPKACCIHRHPHQMVSRGPKACARKSIAGALWFLS